MEEIVNNQPVVSISCITYNHEKYIRDAIEGFLMQKTSFPMEILIHDDASKDTTADIIREYEAKHPDIIYPIYQTENQYSKGISISATYQFPRARGKYIALCEGDDYWTDPYKLQKQMDFLEANNTCQLVHHNVFIKEQDSKKLRVRHSKNLKHKVGLYEMVHSNKCTTLSVMFRRAVLEKIKKEALMGGDRILFSAIAVEGSIGYIDEVMGVYSMHNQGVYTGLRYNKRIEIRLRYYDFVLNNLTFSKKHIKQLVFNRKIKYYFELFIYYMIKEFNFNKSILYLFNFMKLTLRHFCSFRFFFKKNPWYA